MGQEQQPRRPEPRDYPIKDPKPPLLRPPWGLAAKKGEIDIERRQGFALAEQEAAGGRIEDPRIDRRKPRRVGHWLRAGGVDLDSDRRQLRGDSVAALQNLAIIPVGRLENS